MVVSQDFISVFIIAFPHVPHHFFEAFIRPWDVHPMTDRILSDPDLFRKVIFVDPVDPFIVQNTQDLHVHIGVCHLPGIRVRSGGTHSDHSFLDPIRVFLITARCENQAEGSAFQQFTELIDILREM